jgi:hypothetical protein
VARIRTIKPETPQSASMGRVRRESRLCFILLWTLADDAGRLRGDSRMLASLLYPYDDDAKDHMEGWLVDLVREKCIRRYEVDGDHYIEICNWLTHQKIDKPSKSKIPPPPEASRILASPREHSPGDQGSRTKEGTKDQGPVPDARELRTALDGEFEAFIEATYPQTSHGRNTIVAVHRAQGLIGSGKVTEAELRQRLTAFRAFVDSGGYTDASKVPAMASWFEANNDKRYWSRDWKPVPSKAQRQQDANISASQQWLRDQEDCRAAG